MPTIPCNNYVQIVQSEDICLGERKSASCVIDSSVYSEISLPANSTQQEINQALYLTAITTKEVTDGLQTQIDLTDGSETKITVGNNISIEGVGTISNPYIIESINILIPPLEKLTEGVNSGIVIRGRDHLKYGEIGSDAVDLSYSTTNSSLYGATGRYSFASGDEVISSSYGSVALNSRTIASNDFAFASGYESKATGYMSTAMGNDTVASGNLSYAEGGNTLAAGEVSHAEGLNTEAIGRFSHSQNYGTIASGDGSTAGGIRTRAEGDYSFTSGVWTEANSFAESSIGMYGTTYTGNLTEKVNTDRVFNVGNGTSDLIRSNALTILKNGLATLPSVTNDLISAEPTGKAVVTKEFLATVNGNYVDDVAAASGGVSVGQMYHTAGVVKIRLS